MRFRFRDRCHGKSFKILQNPSSFQSRLFVGLAWVLASVLLITAFLKSQLLLTDPYADLNTGYGVGLLWAAVAVELYAVWFTLQSPSLHVLWLLYIVVFAIFASFAAYAVAMGFERCNCAGVLTVAPITMLALDMSVVVTLAFGFPHYRRLAVEHLTRWLCVSPLSAFARLSGLGLSLLLIVAIHSAPVRSLLLEIFGRNLVSVEVVDIVEQPANGVLHFSVVLENRSDHPVSILGTSKSCGCIVDPQYPRTVAAHSKIRATLHVKRKNSDSVHQRVYFFLDSPQQHVASVDLVGSRNLKGVQ